MKKSLFSLIFLTLTAFSFYQCQKDATLNNASAAKTSQLVEDRGGPLCPVSVKADVDGNVCGSSTGNGFCTTCTGINSNGSANFPAGQEYIFTPSTIIFSIRNNVDIPGNFDVSNANGGFSFTLAGNECKDFYLSGCTIIEL
jgi:hypothetical protein